MKLACETGDAKKLANTSHGEEYIAAMMRFMKAVGIGEEKGEDAKEV